MMKIRKIAHATFAATLLTFAACGDDSNSVSAENVASSSAAEECNSVGYIPFRYTKGCLAPDSLIACEEYTTANYAGSIEISTACSSGRLIFFIGDEQKDGLGIKKLPEGIYSRIGPFYFESEKYSYTVTLDSARVVDKSTGEVWHFKEKG